MGEKYNARWTSWIFTFVVVVSSFVIWVLFFSKELLILVCFGIYIVPLQKEGTRANILRKQKRSMIMWV